MRISLSVVIIAMVKTGKSSEMKPIFRYELNKIYVNIANKINVD